MKPSSDASLTLLYPNDVDTFHLPLVVTQTLYVMQFYQKQG